MILRSTQYYFSSEKLILLMFVETGKTQIVYNKCINQITLSN